MGSCYGYIRGLVDGRFGWDTHVRRLYSVELEGPEMARRGTVEIVDGGFEIHYTAIAGDPRPLRSRLEMPERDRFVSTVAGTIDPDTSDPDTSDPGTIDPGRSA